MEVDGRDRRDGVDAQALGVGRKLHAVGGVVAGHMGDDHDTAFVRGHDILKNELALGDRLVDALAGGTAHIQALDPLSDEILRQFPHGLRRDRACFVIAGIEGRENALIFFQILSHSFRLHITRKFSP